MEAAIKKRAVITENVNIIQDVFSMWIAAEDIAGSAVPGQFVLLYCNDGSRLLPRPVSICEIDRKNGRIRLVYRIVGNGTKEFSLLDTGDTLEVMGPLGNGFHPEGTKALLIGGGIGIPPLLALAKQLQIKMDMVLGFRDVTFLDDEFTTYGKVYISTEDGSTGTKGNVLDAIREHSLSADIIYACGPTPMLRAVQAFALENGIKAQLSLEERMACGIGACLGCICKTREVDQHTNVKNKRVCKDGPVFYADETSVKK